MFYFIIQTIHLFCAAIVVGYLIYDIFVFSAFKKKRNDTDFKELKREILKPSIMLFAPAFLLLLLSGVILANFYFGEDLGFWQNEFQKILWLKIAIVSLLFVFAPISFYYIFILKKPDPFKHYYHHIALVICLLALILAKILFLA